MVAEPVDKGLLKLRAQIDQGAPNRRKGSDGFKGDADHASRVSDHNPESPPPPGNPDNQIDAGDFTHDPRNDADMGRISESIRASKDRRVRYVIFNRRIFRSYAHNGVPAWTWGEYTGENPHTLHMHVSVNDVHHDETQDWSIGMDSATEKAMSHRVRSIIRMLPKNPYGDDLKPEDNELAEAINGITDALAAMAAEVAKILPVLAKITADLAKITADLADMKVRMDALEQGPEPVYFGTAAIRLESRAPGVAEAMLDEIHRGGQ